MNRTGILILTALLCVLFLYQASYAGYQYPGSAAYQTLAVMEPATPDSLFHNWTGDLETAGRYNLGFFLDFLRNADDSDDWDEIFAVTGSFRSGQKLLFGATLPYIIRDPDFNESDFLDLRLFARMRLLGQVPSFRVSGEVSAILPTAQSETLFPFTLDSTVLGVRLAFAGGGGKLRAGGTLGYQNYLETESGDDSDLTYGIWLERNIDGPWSFVAEYFGSKHTHSGPPGDDDVSDNYFQAGIRRAQSDRVDLGFAVGSGIGSDAVADIRTTVMATVRFGKVQARAVGEEKPREITEEPPTPAEVKKEPEKVAPPPAKKPAVKPYTGIIVVMMAEGVADRDTERRITRALQQKGYATGMDPDPGVKIPKKNVLYYNPGMQEQAIAVSRLLVANKYLKDLEVLESPIRITRDWLLLIPGGVKKK